MRRSHYVLCCDPEKGPAFIARMYNKDLGAKRRTKFGKLVRRIRKQNTQILPYLCKSCAVLVDAFQEGKNGVPRVFQGIWDWRGLVHEARVDADKGICYSLENCARYR